MLVMSFRIPTPYSKIRPWLRLIARQDASLMVGWVLMMTKSDLRAWPCGRRSRNIHQFQRGITPEFRA